jgi:hypothetical protein
VSLQLMQVLLWHNDLLRDHNLLLLLNLLLYLLLLLARQNQELLLLLGWLELLLQLDWACGPLLDWLVWLLGLLRYLLLGCRLLLLKVRVWYLTLCSYRRHLSAYHASTHLVHSQASCRHNARPLHGYLTHIHLLLNQFLREDLHDFHLEGKTEPHVCEGDQILHLPIVHKEGEVDRDVLDVHIWGRLRIRAEYLDV